MSVHNWVQRSSAKPNVTGSCLVGSDPAYEVFANSASNPLPGRALAILRAVESGRAGLILGCEPDMVIDGLACCDQFIAHDLARAGLVRPARPGLVGQCVPAVLTAAGFAAIEAPPSVA